MNPEVPAQAATLPWGRGDMYTLIIGIIIFSLGCLWHRKAIISAGNVSADVISGIMSSALSFGPLLMIVVDPFLKYSTIVKIDLLSVVMNESRITLWFAAFLALVNSGMAFIRAK